MHYDLLAKIKNAQRARKDMIVTQYSAYTFAVAEALSKAGYLKDPQKKTVGKKNFIEAKIVYHRGIPAMADFKICSKPGRRLYAGYKDLKPVKQNYGVALLSTPKGIMSNKDARKEKVGGEYLCEIW